MSNRAAFLEIAKGKFIINDVDIEQPGEGEVLVKVHASAIQPADAKVAKLAILPMEYPTVLGSPVAGIVEALGPGVTKIKVGERIVCGTKIFVAKKSKYGGHQRFSIVDESEVVEIGETDFAKATTLGSYTPPGALFGSTTLNLHRPTIPESPLPVTEQGKKILIWGGSSAMGSLSISYAKQAGYTVISTSSPHNFSLLKSLGADHIFDHSDPQTVDQIRSLFPIDYWFDTISLPSTLATIVKILAPEGGPVTKANILLLLPPSMPGMPRLPDGITAQMHRFSTHAPENKDWAEWLLSRGGFLERGIKEGIIRGVPPEVIGGLESVEEGIEKVNTGVSGVKIVIDPWA
ncbi:GroES-like protein [Aaosphaeria arxii CBS 175.79]|uniref:GroES-like protein n=1 Tax=Aaosphaeria arxii CBS 175.79 TaxID=1450172 RepID=A0A6A5XMK4_9PLEO|nr:GroES-like protein [Aaosphaeria arxii CBS 175.79]KAF2014475.1 GroES-like protein [Aaosphaeria arxii CBS 175.79]